MSIGWIFAPLILVSLGTFLLLIKLKKTHGIEQGISIKLGIGIGLGCLVALMGFSAFYLASFQGFSQTLNQNSPQANDLFFINQTDLTTGFLLLNVLFNSLSFGLVVWFFNTHSPLANDSKKSPQKPKLQDEKRAVNLSSVSNYPNASEAKSLYQSQVTVVELEILTARFVGFTRMRETIKAFIKQSGEKLSPEQLASPALIAHTERVLAEVCGVSSARLVLRSALQGRHMQLEEVAIIVDEASELLDFSRGLLQGAIEHINQGISVVDKQLRLVAWNQRYVDLFNFPPELIQVGRPIADVIRYNAERGLCGEGDVETQIAKRVAYLHQGAPHTSSRVHPDGRLIEVQGNPMPGGGFVMSFADITAFMHAENALKLANESLEARVVERTHALLLLNARLTVATEKAEFASFSKSRFLAAVSHDLMQPLNAARLFASSLTEMAKDEEVRKVSHHIESALGAAEDLICDLLDISRLESGKMKANISYFALEDIFSALAAEFGMIANEQGIDFKVQHTKLYISSDKRLLRRVLQNFLTNAFRYNPKGKVLLGVRRFKDTCRIEVWDDGPGIEQNKQQDIFDEFTRIERKGTELGLGLGLAIARGISRLLNQGLSLHSWPNQATVFAIEVPRVSAEQCLFVEKQTTQSLENELPFLGLKVLCIDNEKNILIGMENLLSRWGCDLVLAESLAEVEQYLAQGIRPDVILSDYHLCDGFTGLDVLDKCQNAFSGKAFIGGVITADRSPLTRELIKNRGYAFITKPVKPLKLRALLQQCLVVKDKSLLVEMMD